MNDTVQAYHRAQDELEAVLAKISADQWDSPSACSEWSVRDVAGHVIWGQRQMRAWATGEEYSDRSGAPGSPHPGTLTGDDPLQTYREARAAADATLTAAALARTTTLPGVGEIPIVGLLSLLLTDSITHAWDMGKPLGITPDLPADLVTRAFDWAGPSVHRAPGFFGPEVTAPADADKQTRLMAFLGREVK